MKAYFYGIAGFERIMDVDPSKNTIYFAVDNDLAEQIFHRDSRYDVPKQANVKKMVFERVGSIPIYKFMKIDG